jgi:carboxypeptidase Taq
VSVHPFCTGLSAGDTRLTTRYAADAFDGSFFGVLHETGHGLYEQGLPKSVHPGQPVADAVSLGIHESQSRLWENLVGRSVPFWQYFAPLARERFDALKGVNNDMMIRTMNAIEPSYIRVEADELTYNLHILIRFELETRLVASDLAIADLPEAWNERMQKYLGITPPDDARGCLQDVHWAAGLLGYFPTYSLGNLYASQFFEQAKSDLGSLDEHFARGDFAPLLGWLRDRIHRHGRRYTAAQLVQRVTGKSLSSDALIQHLTAKVEKYYG